MTTGDGYVIVASIGSGANARVYSAKRPDDEGPTYAVRFLAIDHVEASDLQAEAQLLSGLDHPNVVRFVEFTALVNPETASIEECLVMELVDGSDLLSLIEADGDLALEYVRAIGRGLISALEYLKRAGIAHCDIHEKNVVVSQVHQKAVLVDLGSARRLTAARTESRERALRIDIMDCAMVLSHLLQRFGDYTARDDFEKRSHRVVTFEQLRVAFDSVLDDVALRRGTR